MVLRFLLGAAEAGFGPSIPFLLSFFYLRHELGARIGFFLSMAPLASTFAGALAYGITSGHSHLANWRLLFLVEGIPTLLMAPVTWFLLPDSPANARFLNEEEKKIARARGVRQTGTVERVGGIDFKESGMTLVDAKAWFTAVSWNLPIPTRHQLIQASSVNVLLMQCILLLAPRLPAHHLKGNGILRGQRPGSLS